MTSRTPLTFVSSLVRAQGALAVVTLAVWLSGCSGDRTRQQGCAEDSDCGSPASAFLCEPQTGQCYCRTNEACPPSEFCNTAGFCQERTGCERNEDCRDSSLFCDTSSGTCLSIGRCTLDLHCPLGQVCDTARTTCVEGCRTAGDCPTTASGLAISCRCDNEACGCTGTSQGELASCQIGVCDQYFCENENFCAFGEKCGTPDAGSAPAPVDGGMAEVDPAACYSDYDPERKPYCDNCNLGTGISACGRGKNYCLVDPNIQGNSFCGVDCSAGQTCPRGYECSDVVVIYSNQQCTRTNPTCAPDTQLPCAEDTDCSLGYCAKSSGAATGFCAAYCNIGEGEAVGFCSCQKDVDCAQGSCSGGECSLSGAPCAGDEDCRPVRCVDYNGQGGCYIGANCAPASGLSCNDVK